MITSIPNLIKEYGTMAETCRQTGMQRNDDCEVQQRR